MSEEAEKIKEALRSIVERIASKEQYNPQEGIEGRKFDLANYFNESQYTIIVSNAHALMANFLNTVLIAVEESEDDLRKQTKIMIKDFNDLIDFCVSINENKSRIRKDKLKEMKRHEREDE